MMGLPTLNHMAIKLKKLLDQNIDWKNSKNSAYFDELEKGQSPSILWIGCSDSRVSPNLITGTELGDIFVHRNIANLVKTNDPNLMSVLEYSVNALKIPQIIVCGHYGCGGVMASFNEENDLPEVDGWINPLREILAKNQGQINSVENPINHLVELNVKTQVENLAQSEIIQRAWEKKNTPAISGWVFDLSNGLLKEIHSLSSPKN